MKERMLKWWLFYPLCTPGRLWTPGCASVAAVVWAFDLRHGICACRRWGWWWWQGEEGLLLPRSRWWQEVSAGCRSRSAEFLESSGNLRPGPAQHTHTHTLSTSHDDWQVSKLALHRKQQFSFSYVIILFDKMSAKSSYWLNGKNSSEIMSAWTYDCSTLFLISYAKKSSNHERGNLHMKV